MRLHHSLAVVLGVVIVWPLASADAPSPEGRQKLFDLSAERKRLAVERERIDKRLAEIDSRLAELEKAEFTQFERVANPTGSDYWESISDTVLFATATRNISKGELLVYHSPGIYRVKDVKPKLTTKGECWYFRPDRDVEKGQRLTIERVYDAPEEIALMAKGFAPVTERARDPQRPYRTKITIGN